MSTPSQAPYARVGAELRRRITSGTLAAGDRVPSTRQIAQEFGVASATATKALDVLRREKLIVTRPRSGSVVAAGNVRRSPAGPPRPLDRKRIVEAAIDLADAEGLDAVSMRAVAARCGAATMSLYRHVDGKDELVLLMADTAFGRGRLGDGEAGDWRAEVERLMRLLWRLHREHPWLARLSPLTRPLPLPNLLAIGDRLLGALEPLGLRPKAHFDLHVLLYHHVTGLASNFEEEYAAQSETGLSAEEWTDLQYALPAARSAALPHFAAVVDRLTADGGYDLELDELFELGLTALLDGIAALAGRRGAGL